jgi:hypothetical protein
VLTALLAAGGVLDARTVDDNTAPLAPGGLPLPKGGATPTRTRVRLVEVHSVEASAMRRAEDPLPLAPAPLTRTFFIPLTGYLSIFRNPFIPLP